MESRRETEFSGQRQNGRNRPFVSERNARDEIHRGNARQFGAICVFLGNTFKILNAWWAREDSNLQPDRYERGYLIGSTGKI